MIFQKLCNSITVPGHISQLSDDESNVSDELRKRAHVLCDIMRTKVDIVDRIEIPFIEAEFEDMNRATELLSQYNDGEVPDFLFKLFSSKLYHKDINDLNDAQQAIIKTLSAYLCISIQSSNNQD